MKQDHFLSGEGGRRRKILAGLGIFSLASLLKLFSFPRKRETIACSPPGPGQTGKLLTQDGQLVEVDMSKIKLLKQKISDEELREWIRKQ